MQIHLVPSLPSAAAAGATALPQDPPVTGFFVDWNGDTRRMERPGLGYTCQLRRMAHDGQPYFAIDVLDSEGFVSHEAVYYPSLAALQAVGVSINLIEQPAVEVTVDSPGRRSDAAQPA